jgi:lysophospholipase L1-like esterase
MAYHRYVALGDSQTEGLWDGGNRSQTPVHTSEI